MKLGNRQSAVLLLTLCVAFSAEIALGRKKQKLPVSPLDPQKQALHALNRLTFGPRPGDVDRVLAAGIDNWIDQQLHPEQIDDAALEVRLAPFRTLRMDPKQLVDNFPSNPMIKEVADGKRGLPSDPLKRAVYEAQVEKYEQKQDSKAGGEHSTIPQSNFQEDIDASTEDLLDLPPDQRMKAVLRLSPDDRRALTASLKGEQKDEFLQGMNPRQRETMQALNDPRSVVVQELIQAKLLRAIYSAGQLQEVMTDFWFNHFNVFIGKDADRYLLTGYERDVIRPHVFGKFEDLLVSTAQSPAMLFYLDNWLSVGPNSDVANGIRNRQDWKRRARANGPQKQSKGNRNGLNENYGRELMELHTLGVNGGYTQEDVTNVAKVFTGWTLKQPRKGGGFTFEERMHEPGDKIVLGHRIKPNGEKEGLEVLHILAHQPATAKFVCGKLAMRFVSDDPPPVLVDRMAQTFLKKDGDIREVLKTMFSSPEFWSPETYRAKVKTPLEFVVSAVRATGADVSEAMPLANQLQNMGMRPYSVQPPTGYSMKASTWVNSAALLDRMNFSMALTAGKIRGVAIDPDHFPAAASVAPTDAQGTLAALENSLLAGDVSKQTHDVISARLQEPKISRRKLDDSSRPPNTAAIEGLLLGSPEFQRR
jgi:uncharacterized protein (DUF1800 family)